MKIGLVRQGETIYNKLGKLQGISNIPLSDDGRRECKKLKEELVNKKYDICFSSPLIRAMETAMILVGDKVEIKMDDRLIERNFGEFEGKFIDKYDLKKYWDYQLNSDDDNVEKIQDLFKRCEDFISYLKENYNDKNILIVTHEAVLRTFHHILHNTNLNSDLLSLEIGNCYYEEIDI